MIPEYNMSKPTLEKLKENLAMSVGKAVAEEVVCGAAEVFDIDVTVPCTVEQLDQLATHIRAGGGTPGMIAQGFKMHCVIYVNLEKKNA